MGASCSSQALSQCLNGHRQPEGTIEQPKIFILLIFRHGQKLQDHWRALKVHSYCASGASQLRTCDSAPPEAQTCNVDTMYVLSSALDQRVGDSEIHLQGRPGPALWSNARNQPHPSVFALFSATCDDTLTRWTKDQVGT